MISFHFYDFIVIGIFFIVLIYAGMKFTGGVDNDDYTLGGQKLSLIPFIMTNVATWYGGILGIGEYTYRYGLSSWFTQGFPYYLFAALFALFLARKIRVDNSFTIPQLIGNSYGKLPARYSALLVFFLVSPAPYLLMSAKIVSVVFTIPLFPALIISALLCLVYLIPFGFKSDVGADMFLFVVMFIGFIMVFVTGYFRLGGLDYLSTHLPAEHLTFSGGLPVTVIIVWWLIGLWTFIDPGFFQRTKAAASPEVAVKGILLSIALWLGFDFLTTSTGLYARAAIPGLTDPSQSYLLLAEKILVPGAKGFFYAALLATILSTLNSFVFLSGVTFARDITGTQKDNIRETKKIRIGMVLASGVAIIICLLIPSVIEIWFALGSYFVPGLIYLLLGVYFNFFAVEKEKAIYPVVIPSVSGILWDVLRKNHLIPGSLDFIEPMFAGLIAGAIVVILFRENRNRLLPE